MKVKVAQLCPTLCDPMDYTLHGILQARILEWIAFAFSRGSSQTKDQTHISCIAGRFFTSWAIKEARRAGWDTAISGISPSYYLWKYAKGAFLFGGFSPIFDDVNANSKNPS